MRLSYIGAALLAVALGCGDDAPAGDGPAAHGDAGTAADARDRTPISDEGSSAGAPGAAPDDAPPIQRTDDSTELRRVSTGPAVGRRLTRHEYFNSIESVLGVALDRDAFDLPRDPRAPGGFRNDTDVMVLSPAHVQAYFEIGLAAAEQLDTAAIVAAHASCPSAIDACFEGLIASFGEQVLRGPLSQQEVAGYLLAVDGTVGATDRWDAGVKAIVRVMLQSPRFVYRLEQQGADGAGSEGLRPVSDYELATRLSFLLWNAAPDAELIALAEAGELEAQWGAQVERLMAHPFARRALAQYVEQWLHLDSIPSAFVLADAMKQETYRLFETILWEQEADLMEVFRSQRIEVSGDLARFYDLPVEAEGVRAHDVGALPHRSGFLSNAAVIAAHTVNPSTSQIDRGLFVLRDVLCQDITAPTGEALQDAIAEARIPESSGLSQRERFAMQREDPLCGGCHGVFDPLGEAFEIFDGLGQYQQQDSHGNALASRGQVAVGGLQFTYESFQEFTEALAESEEVARCMVEKSIQHAYGRKLAEGDADLIEEVAQAHARGGRSYRALLTEIAAHPSFRTVEVAE